MNFEVFDPSVTYYGIYTNRNGSYYQPATTKSDLNEALSNNDFMRASRYLADLYGSSSYEAQEGYLKIVQKIVDLNGSDRFSQVDKDLGRTIENAYSLGCKMYTTAKNTKDRRFMNIAISALTLVANCAAGKNNFNDAVHYLNRLDDEDRQQKVAPMLQKWETYINTSCPDEKKPQQSDLYGDAFRAHARDKNSRRFL